MKVLMVPHRTQLQGESGINRVVEAYFRHLPEFGVELVSPDATGYDLKAVHAGATGADCDVSHNHGLYWTADYPASDAEFAANANVILALRAAREITVPSRWVADNIARDMRFLPHVVPHGIDWDAWQHDEANGEYVLWNKNRTADVCDPTPVLELAKWFPSVQFVSTFASLPAPNVTVTGLMSHASMKKAIQGAGVYLATTKETFGIGILEAMAAGVPVLGYAHGGILDLVRHETNGYLAKPGNLADLADGLHYCIMHNGRLGRVAREAARAYTWEKACEQIAQIYERASQTQPATCCIVIPSYNYAHTLGRALDGAISQTYPLLTDIVVVDDGSADNGATGHVVRQYMQSDPRVRYTRQENQGVAYARNNGIVACDTKYVCCLDADDTIAPKFLSVMISPLEAEPTLGITYSGLTLVHHTGRGRLGTWPGRFDFDRQMDGHNQVPTCCVFRRQMWERLGGYKQRYAPGGAGAEDAEFWLRAGAYGYDARKVTEEPLFIYSLFTGGVSGNRYYKEMNWCAWHPWTQDGGYPFASVATPARASHSVRQYDEPEVSVVIPVGPRHARVLPDALDSLEAQTFRKWEAIVINDTGHDLDLSSYPYVRIVTTTGEKGTGFARNRGVEIAHAGAFVCLDADDFLQPTFLAEVLDEWKDNPERWIYTDMYILHPDGKTENYRTKNWDPFTLWRRGIAAVTCLYPKVAWEQVGGFDEESEREDWDFHLRLARAGWCGIRIPLPLFTYRHATGWRRDAGTIQRSNRILKGKYSREDIEMGCKGCGSSPRQKARAVEETVPLTNWTSKADAGWPLLEFIGGNRNDLTFRGSVTHRTYLFGNNNYHRFCRVHPDDSVRLALHQFLRLVSIEKPSETVADDVLTSTPSPKMTVEPPVEKIEAKAEDKAEAKAKAEVEAKAEIGDDGRAPDMASLSVRDIQQLRLTLVQWQDALVQETTREHPRKSVVSFVRRKIRVAERVVEGVSL